MLPRSEQLHMVIHTVVTQNNKKPHNVHLANYVWPRARKTSAVEKPLGPEAGLCPGAISQICFPEPRPDTHKSH